MDSSQGSGHFDKASDIEALLEGIQLAGKHDAGLTIQQVRNNSQLDQSGKKFDLLQSLMGGGQSQTQDPLFSHTPAFPQKGYTMPTSSDIAQISPDDPRLSLLVRTSNTPVLDIRHFLSQESL